MVDKIGEKNEVSEKKPMTPALKNKQEQALIKYEAEFRKVLPSHVSAERFLRICASEITKNPNLLDCTTVSFLGSVMLSAQMGLEIGGHLGHSFLIPYKNQCSLQFGYKGLLELVRRSNLISAISVQNVFTNDKFSIDPLNNKVEFEPLLQGDRGQWYVTVAVALMKDGTKHIDFMTKEQIMKRKAVAMTKKVWDQWEERMAEKTVLKSLCRLLPLSIEDMRLINAEEKIITKLDANLNNLIESSESIYIEENTGNVDEKPKAENAVDELFNN